MTTAEQRISDVEDPITPLTAETRSAQQQLTDHSAKLNDLEDRLRHNNLRFIDFPEGSESKELERFMENWLRSTMSREVLSPLFAIEQAHCVPL